MFGPPSNTLASIRLSNAGTYHFTIELFAEERSFIAEAHARVESQLVVYWKSRMPQPLIESNACPARRKEMHRVEQAKEVRSTYWHVPTRENRTAMESPNTNTGVTNRRSSGRQTRISIQTDTLEPEETEAQPAESVSATDIRIEEPAVEVQVPADSPAALTPNAMSIEDI
ncbi:hypothetical protein F5X98DRAFT_381358 [Xylaria grammica]|nr:hypothetical protein F5X98DRAFT_381358 [Xylaria grammica]